MNLVKVSYKSEQTDERDVDIIGDIVCQEDNVVKLWPYVISKDGGPYEGVVDELMVVDKAWARPLKETNLFEVYMSYAETVQTRQKKQPQIQLQEQTT